MMTYKNLIQHFIEEKHLFTIQDKVLVALSGGADSVALLRVLVELGYSCECAHCNFHLRGEESNRDETFVRELCQSLDIPLHVIHFDTKTYAKKKHLSIEMAARELRYEWFEKVRREIHAEVIAVAHHRDDSVETFLLNLIRGTGINGLKGIPVRNGLIVRPLLHTSKTDILNYLSHLKQDYVTDSTNLQDEYMRNKIRLNLIPLMETMNPSIAETIDETAQKLTEVADIYHQNRKTAIQNALQKTLERNIEETEGRNSMDIETILSDIAPFSLLHEWLAPKGFNATQINDIYFSLKQCQSGKRFASTEWELLRDRKELVLQRKNPDEKVPQIAQEIVEIDPEFILLKDKNMAFLDADKVILPLEIRRWQAGDKFCPLGMKGKKNVSDYLTDKKFTLFEKERQYVACSEGKIVWLVGERIDNRFKITESTKRALVLRIE